MRKMKFKNEFDVENIYCEEFKFKLMKITNFGKKELIFKNLTNTVMHLPNYFKREITALMTFFLNEKSTNSLKIINVKF